MKTKDTIQSIIFDFDGVIAESVDIKTEAFRELFKDYPAHLEHIEKYHVENGGISRLDKFRFIYKNILHEELSDKRFKDLCDKFEGLVIEKVITCPFVKGATELLDYCLNKFDMYVVSGTPMTEIKEIVKRRGLAKYFLGVYGSPFTKAELIGKVLRNKNYSAEKVLFIGDSINDFLAAKETGIKFIARILNKRQHWIDNNDMFMIGKFNDAAGIKNFIEINIKNGY